MQAAFRFSLRVFPHLVPFREARFLSEAPLSSFDGCYRAPPDHGGEEKTPFSLRKRALNEKTRKTAREAAPSVPYTAKRRLRSATRLFLMKRRKKREGFSQRPASAQKIPCGTPLKNISPVPQDVFLPEAYVIACNINKLPCICVFFFLRKKELLVKVPAFPEKPLALIVVLPLFYYRKNCMHFPDFYNPSGRGCHDQS